MVVCLGTLPVVKPRSKRRRRQSGRPSASIKFMWGATLVFLLGLVSTSSWALPVTYHFQGINFPDSIRAAAVLDYQASAHTITVSLANTSTVVSSITAFAFNVPPEVLGVAAFSSDSSSNWSFLFELDAIDTPDQLGNFDLAGITKKDFNGGKVAHGIFPGQTFQFSFTFSGSGLDSLSSDDFNRLSADPGLGQPQLQPMVVRFQGILPDDDSDVGVTDSAVPETPGSPGVPLPGAVWLFGSGLAGLVVWRRKYFS